MTENKPDQLAETDNFSALVKSDAFKHAVATALPAHLTPERFVRIALTARIRTPKLKECDRDSLLQCLMQLSQFGLEPDGRHAHLVPFWNSRRNVTECVLIIDYKGLANLAMRSGKISYVHADKVCENDNFEYNKGQIERHVIDFTKDRGKAYAYYAMVRFKDGSEKADAMTMDEVKKIKARSRAGDSGPWITDFDEMGKKTVFRRLSKWLPLSAEYRDAVDLDADTLEELRFENAKPLEIKRAKVPNNLTAVPALAEAPAICGNPNTERRVGNDGEARQAPLNVAAAVISPYDENMSDTQRTNARVPLKRKKAAHSDDLTPMRFEMLRRLGLGNKTPVDLLKVAVAHEWCQEDEHWPLPEEKLERFLDAENWAYIMEELDKVK